MSFREKADEYCKKGWIDSKSKELATVFYEEYERVVEKKGDTIENHEGLFSVYLDLIRQQLKDPYPFEHYHRQLRAPIDYYLFGMEFLRPLLNYGDCKTYGLEIFDQIEIQLEKGENVVFFANHQSESDPFAVSLLLEKTHPKLGENMISVAGHRVTTDPLAVPFSLGLNLLCIYSKRHIDHPPEEKEQKQRYNNKTMAVMTDLLREGGKAIYMAPSGGRDRLDENGKLCPAEFDPASIEMFCLMARKAGVPTHFYPLALATYNLLPPPETVEKEIGEKRRIKGGGIGMAVGNELNMAKFPGSDTKDKHEKRKNRAKHIYSLVKEHYETLI